MEVGTEAEASGLSPDHRLMVAVLIRAVRDFVNYRDAPHGSDEHKLAVDAAGWIFWDGREDMTFLKICETVGLNAGKIRRVTLTLTRDELLRMSKVADEPDIRPGPEDDYSEEYDSDPDED